VDNEPFMILLPSFGSFSCFLVLFSVLCFYIIDATVHLGTGDCLDRFITDNITATVLFFIVQVKSITDNECIERLIQV